MCKLTTTILTIFWLTTDSYNLKMRQTQGAVQPSIILNKTSKNYTVCSKASSYIINKSAARLLLGLYPKSLAQVCILKYYQQS